MKNLGPFLPFLRPRSGEVTWYLALLLALLCLGGLLIAAGYLLRLHRHRQELRSRFLMLAGDKGLTPPQSRLLLDMTTGGRLESAHLLLTSVHTFDRYVSRYLDSRPGHATEGRLKQLDVIRHALGFDQVPRDQPLASSRQLGAGTTLMMALCNEESPQFEAWILVARDERVLTVAPLLHRASILFGALAAGIQVKVRFWREGDTEYRFTTLVTRIDRERRAVDLAHASPIERLQHRDFYRLPLRFAIEFATIEEEPSDRIRLTGQVLNISAGGMLATVEKPVPTDALLQIPADFVGPLPLAGLLCEVVQQTQDPRGATLQLRFQHVDPAREKELVRLIYEYQIAGRQGEPETPP